MLSVLALFTYARCTIRLRVIDSLNGRIEVHNELRQYGRWNAPDIWNTIGLYKIDKYKQRVVLTDLLVFLSSTL